MIFIALNHLKRNDWSSEIKDLVEVVGKAIGLVAILEWYRYLVLLVPGFVCGAGLGEIYRHACCDKEKIFNAMHEMYTKPRRGRPRKLYRSVGSNRKGSHPSVVQSF